MTLKEFKSPSEVRGDDKLQAQKICYGKCLLPKCECDMDREPDCVRDLLNQPMADPKDVGCKHVQCEKLT